MKTQIVKGKLEVINKLNHSFYGNPRYEIKINGEKYKTQINASLGYNITNFDGREVIAEVGIHYNAPHVFNVTGA